MKSHQMSHQHSCMAAIHSSLVQSSLCCARRAFLHMPEALQWEIDWFSSLLWISGNLEQAAEMSIVLGERQQGSDSACQLYLSTRCAPAWKGVRYRSIKGGSPLGYQGHFPGTPTMFMWLHYWRTELILGAASVFMLHSYVSALVTWLITNPGATAKG